MGRPRSQDGLLQKPSPVPGLKALAAVSDKGPHITSTPRVALPICSGPLAGERSTAKEDLEVQKEEPACLRLVPGEARLSHSVQEPLETPGHLVPNSAIKSRQHRWGRV